MKLLFKILLIFLVSFGSNVNANDEPVEFSDTKLEQRYHSLIEETRCLVCQNQSLADSHAELAQDLRKDIYDMVVSGKNDEEIIQFLVDRYGDFVLYRPPLKESTWLLWFGPFLFLLIGLFAAIIIIKKQSSANNDEVQIDKEQQRRLNEILDEKSNGVEK